MTFARKVAALAVAMVALSTIFLGVGAASAATTIGPCDLPEVSISQDTAESFVADVQPRACLDITFTDKCDGTTVVEMKNGAFSDNKFTVLTVELDGKEYTLKGGSDPNTETVVLGPKVEDLQAKLVFRFTTPGGEFTRKKNFGDPWTWTEPKGCVSPSPSPSVTASASPSASASASASTTTPAAPAPQAEDPDLPVTGQSLFGTISVGVGLLCAGIVALVVIARRRRV